MAKRWIVRLGRYAERDLAGIAAWSEAQFGAQQAIRYVEAIGSAINEIAIDPVGGRSKARDDDIGAGFRTLHMRNKGRRGSHLVLYQCDEMNGLILVLRILHDSMDLSRHLPLDSES